VTIENRPGGEPQGRRRAARVPTDRVSLLIVDRHPVLRAGVRALLENEPRLEVVGEVDSLAQAVVACASLSPQVVLFETDESAPETIEDMRRLRREAPDCALVVLARHEDDEEVYRAVLGGASGHVGGQAAPAELIATISEAAAGGEPIQHTLAERPSVGRRVLETYAEMAQRVPSTSDVELTERELRILELAAEGKTNSEIGREIGVSEHTVKGAISHLLARLRLSHRTEAVVHALRLGWIAGPRIQRQPQPQPQPIRQPRRR
jgi:DNA-binding NarL/FixJ family response regulator